MVFEHIEKLKRDYTDKYVVVDDRRPELARFKGQTGRVKTVNMSGKALVEFPQHANVSWYDIDVDYLKVVDRPAPKEPEKKKTAPKQPAAKKAAPASPPAGEKKPSALELARMQGAGGAKKEAAQPAGESAKKPAGGKPSTADILAAARGKAAAATEDKPAAAASQAPAKKPSEMTMAEKIAAMRGETGGGAAAPATDTSATEDDSTPAAEETAPVEQAEQEQISDPVPEKPATPAESGEKIDRSTMSVEDMIAWCRDHDSGG